MIKTTEKAEAIPTTETNANQNIDSRIKPDFSFFDEPVSSNSEKPEISENDFSFLDEPFQTGETVLPEKPSTENFSFDDMTTEPDNKNQSSEESVKKTTSSFEEPAKQKMIFTCLKCRSKEDSNLPAQHESELNLSCSGCSSTIKIILESNSQRATQKSTEIYCCNCGSPLLHTPHCPACGTYCPDYYIVEDPAEAQRKARIARSNNIKQTLENFKSSLTWQKKEATISAPSTATATSAKTKNLSAFFQNHIKLLAVSAVLIISIATVVFLYFQKQVEQQFTTNYIKALYAIHIGSESILTSMNQSSNDWKNAIASGSPYIPKSDLDLELRTGKINAELSKIMTLLQNKIPKKYESQFGKLQSLENEYKQLQKVSTTKPSSFEKQTTVIKTSEQNIKTKKQDLKAGLNEDLQNELENAKKKFRGFNNF